MNKKLVVFLLFCHSVLSFDKQGFLKIIKNEKISSSSMVNNIHGFDEFYEKYPLKGSIGQKIQRVIVCSKAAETKYDVSPSKKYKTKFFFKELDDFFSSLDHISFKEIKEFEWPEKRCDYTLFMRFRKLNSFILDLMFDKSENRSVQKKLDSFDKYKVIESLFKFSAIIEKSHTGLIGSIVPRSKDKVILSAVKRLFNERKFKLYDINRIFELMDRRKSCSFSFEEALEREVESATQIFKRTDKYFFTMFFVNLFHGNAVKQYISLVNEFKSYTPKDEIYSKLKKCNIMVQLLLPNFWRAEKKMKKLNSDIASFKRNLKIYTPDHPVPGILEVYK